MSRLTFATLVSVCVGMLALESEVFADAKEDVRIVERLDKFAGVNIAYAQNTNTGRAVVATIAVTETTNGQSRRLPDRVVEIPPGGEVSLGGVKSGNSTYQYRVAGATY